MSYPLKPMAIVIAAVFGSLCAAASHVLAQDSAESERLNDWLEAQFEAGLERSPTAKTRLGIIDDDYGAWDDLSPGFREESFRLGQEQLAEMRERFDFDALDEQARLSWRLFEFNKEQERAAYPFREHAYTFNQMFGLQSSVPAFLINQHRVSEAAHAEAYIERLRGVESYLDQAMANARRRMETGIMPPRFVYAHVIRDARNVISGAPFEEAAESDSPLLADFKSKVAALALAPEREEALVAGATAAMRQHLQPAYEALIQEMQRQQGQADDRAGAWKLPRGEAYYAQRLEQSTTTELSADAVHELGLRETQRIHDAMRGIMAEVRFEGSLQEFFEFMRTDERFYYSNDDAGRERYLEEARAIIDDMRGRLDRLFVNRPQAALEVKRVEPFRERSAGKAFYQRPAADGSRPGVYYANLYDMQDMPIYQMQALAYHEGIPGHHMQIAIAQELEGLPRFRRYGGYTAYVEGWGLYAEWVPAQLGLYEDPYADFGRLAMELWRAGRLVVDTGLHHKRWSREDAIEWLSMNTPNPRGDVVKAIERYIVMPGQATAYKIGMLKIQELRARAEQALGEGFDVREFHDVVLANGSVPLPVLESLVDDYITRRRGAPGRS